jgi:hypothetical protein
MVTIKLELISVVTTLSYPCNKRYSLTNHWLCFAQRDIYQLRFVIELRHFHLTQFLLQARVGLKAPQYILIRRSAAKQKFSLTVQQMPSEF